MVLEGITVELMEMEEKSKDRTLGLQQLVMETCRSKGQLALGLRQTGRCGLGKTNCRQLFPGVWLQRLFEPQYSYLSTMPEKLQRW